MTKQPLVSVIMPAYNSEHWISRSLNSVLNQTLKKIEIVVIDDCSSDSTTNIVKDIEKTDSRITLIELERNSGVANARNIGIDRANGQYVAFLDADDCWAKDKLKVQTDYMRAHDCDFSYCDYFLINDENTIIGQRVVSNKELVHKDLLYGNKIGLLTVMLSKEVAKRINFPNMHHEDYACWLAITRSGVVAQKCSTKLLAYYRKYDNSLTANKLQSALWTWNIFRKFEKANIIKSLIYFTGYIFMGLFNKR